MPGGNVLVRDIRVVLDGQLAAPEPGPFVLETVPGRVVRLPESDAKTIPLPLSNKGGGPLPVKQTANPNEISPQTQQYLVTVELPQPDDAIVPGTLVRAKIHCKWQTGAWWVWHTISSAFDLSLI